MGTRWEIYNNQPYYLFGMTKHIYRLMDINHNYIDIPTNEPLEPYQSSTYKVGQTVLYKEHDTLEYI